MVHTHCLPESDVPSGFSFISGGAPAPAPAPASQFAFMASSTPAPVTSVPQTRSPALPPTVPGISNGGDFFSTPNF